MSDKDKLSRKALREILIAASATHELNTVDLWRHDTSGTLARIDRLSFREEDLAILVTYHEDVPGEEIVSFTRTMDNFLARFTRLPS